MKELMEQSYQVYKDKGFEDNPVELGTSLMRVTSELGEALNADRENRYCKIVIALFGDKYIDNFTMIEFERDVKNTFEDEIADAIIRLFDLCSSLEIDVESHIKAKIKYNSMRPKLNGKKY